MTPANSGSLFTKGKTFAQIQNKYDFFSSDEMVFYEGIEDLSNKLNKYKQKMLES